MKFKDIRKEELTESVKLKFNKIQPAIGKPAVKEDGTAVPGFVSLGSGLVVGKNEWGDVDLYSTDPARGRQNLLARLNVNHIREIMKVAKKG